MNTFQSCRNTSDAVPLYLPKNLFLKPIARIDISVIFPKIIEPGKSLSNWEIMEKLKVLVRPEDFSTLKVTKHTLQYIRLEAEIEDKIKLYKMIALLDGRTIKVKTFTQCLRVKASEARLMFPNKHSWDSFFRDAQDMDEMKAGERPDTIHISNLPIKWFVSDENQNKISTKPSLKIFQRIFERFGNIRRVDIPICDPYRTKMQEQLRGIKTFTYNDDTFFEGYVQFKDHLGFIKAMDAFRGMKLLRKTESTAQTVSITVDFDKTKHLSDVSINKRRNIRMKIIANEKAEKEKALHEKLKLEKEEEEKRLRELQEKKAKELRREQREERRKARYFAQLKLNETEELKIKINKEKQKLIKTQKKLEATRLLEVLFERIKVKKEKEQNKTTDNADIKDEVTRYKIKNEKKFEEQKKNFQKTLEGRVVLESILEKNKQKYSTTDSSSSSDSDLEKKRKKNKKHKKRKKSKKKLKKSKELRKESSRSRSSSISVSHWELPIEEVHHYPPIYGHIPRRYFTERREKGIFLSKSTKQFPGYFRGPHNYQRTRGRRPRRGATNSRYPPEIEYQYYKYFSKFLPNDNHRNNSSKSRSRSRSRSPDYENRARHLRSHRRSRSYTRSKSRSKSRSYSRSRSRSRSRRNHHRDRSTSKRKRSYRSRSLSRSSSKAKHSSKSLRSKFVSSNRSSSRSKSRSHSWSSPPTKNI